MWSGTWPSRCGCSRSTPTTSCRSSRLTVHELAERLRAGEDLQLVDVRQPAETAAGTIDGAVEIPLTRLNERLPTLDASKPTVVYCAGGYRSSIAASRMAASGFTDVADLLGGYGAWSAADPLPSLTGAQRRPR